MVKIKKIVNIDNKDSVEFVDLVSDQVKTRRVFNIINNVYKFKYNNKHYYFIQFGIDHYVRFNLTEPELFLGLFIKQYSDYMKPDESVPSGPDTSKFISIRKGNIEFEENYYNHSRSTNYCKFVKIGTAIYHDLSQEFFDKLFSTLVHIMLQNKDVSKGLGQIAGTAWVGYGIKI